MTSAKLTAMRAVVLEVDQEWLAERRRLNRDVRDEVWDGVLHIVPQPTYAHQRLVIRLAMVLEPRACKVGLEVVHEVGVFRLADWSDYRVPDLNVVDPVHASVRGVEMRDSPGLAIAIEMLSPNDESRDKLPFFAKCGVSEVWFIDPPTRTIEIRLLRKKEYVLVTPDKRGVMHAPLLDLKFHTVAGPKLAISWPGGSTEL